MEHIYPVARPPQGTLIGYPSRIFNHLLRFPTFVSLHFPFIAFLPTNSIGSATDKHVSGISMPRVLADQPAPVSPIHTATS